MRRNGVPDGISDAIANPSKDVSRLVGPLRQNGSRRPLAAIPADEIGFSCAERQRGKHLSRNRRRNAARAPGAASDDHHQHRPAGTFGTFPFKRKQEAKDIFVVCLAGLCLLRKREGMFFSSGRHWRTRHQNRRARSAQAVTPIAFTATQVQKNGHGWARSRVSIDSSCGIARRIFATTIEAFALKALKYRRVEIVRTR